MKRSINILKTAVAPSIILLLYTFLTRYVDLYHSLNNKGLSPFSPLSWLVPLLANAAIGCYLFFLCKRIFTAKQDAPPKAIAYLISVLLPLVLFALTFTPLVDWGILNFYLLNCIPQFSILAAVHVAIFLYLLKSDEPPKGNDAP